MGQLAIRIQQLTDELNRIVKYIDKKDDDDDNEMLFRAIFILEDIRKFIMGNPVVRYDVKNNQPFLLFPDGRKEY
ncbi:hypothetical protein GOQ27_14365 [Clostridium sp. D2Q-11]|uniref:Uncharacterized protein n=1 Tax=Anaeromonas frigoriresistens TaxID=2683708 RepID=A0A942UX10_9FIRM|nr:hypothetical protein [Anaeromonas frigoriresistens]MBS4539655.1 hypothetical protein [Anaeromonas frigoriresistens]